MLHLLKDSFTFSYESGASLSYLVIKTHASQKLHGYQVEMIMNNQIPNILHFDVRHMDEEIGLYYDITSKMTLSQFFKRKKLKRNDFIKILLDITKTLLDCNFYLLLDRCFLVDGDYIYINPATLAISMVYMPVMFDVNPNQVMKAFVTDVVVNSAGIDESNSDNFLQKILNLVKSDTFSICDFNGLLNSLQREGCDFAVDNSGEEVYAEKIIIQTLPKLKAPCLEGEAAAKVRSKSRPVVIAVLSQALIVIGIILASHYLKSLSRDATTTYCAVAMIVAAVDILLYTRLFGKKTEAEEGSLGVAKASKAGRYDEKNLAEGVGTIEDGVGVHVENSCETVVLGYGRRDYPYLQAKWDNALEEIPITKDDFLIGRLAEHVDYTITNNSIGKVHARIITCSGIFSVIDLNSRNGTFINDMRIQSNKEYEVKNSDRICFANCEYVFIVPCCKGGNE